MSDTNLLNDHQMDVVNALTEWRDAGGPVESVVLAIQQMIINDMRFVMGHSDKARTTRG